MRGIAAHRNLWIAASGVEIVIDEGFSGCYKGIVGGKGYIVFEGEVVNSVYMRHVCETCMRVMYVRLLTVCAPSTEGELLHRSSFDR